MKQNIAKTISRYRKEQGLTQEGLAQKLGVSYQAVSKWENAQTMPDISMLPALSQTLDVSIDKLLGYASREKQVTIYEEEYKIPSYYWGTEPSKMCYRVLEIMPPTKHLKLLDIGCGEGKDAVFFARNGYDVTAMDISDAGNPNGLHVLNVFVNKPFIAPPPEKEPHAYKWHSGELLAHYHDWLIRDSSEVIFDCNSSGIPHKHAMSKLLAQKV